MYKYSAKGIYQIECLVNHKKYVGQSKVAIGTRKTAHFLNLRRGIHYNREMQKDYDRYGEKNFEFSLIEEVDDIEKLDEREKFWIKEKNTIETGYNLCLGGAGAPGIKRSEETKRMIGEKNAINMLGKKITSETRKKMSDTHKRIPVHPNSLMALLKIAKKPLTKEMKEYLSKINSGENNPTHKYSDIEVLKAKELLDNGLSIRETARQVGMSTSTVHRIKRKQTRKDILN